MRRVYCTGMRRWLSSTKSTKTRMTTSTPVTMPNFSQSPLVPLVPQPISHSCGRKPEQMDMKIKMDIPWPMPLSVINSAIHMIRPVPPVMIRTMTERFHTELSGIGEEHMLLNSAPDCAVTRIVVDCSTARPMVR